MKSETLPQSQLTSLVAILPHDDPVAVQILERHLGACLNHLLRLVHQQPAHVSKKHAAFGVVRVRLGLAVAMVHTMVTRPAMGETL